jgi:hypothetical protein
MRTSLFATIGILLVLLFCVSPSPRAAELDEHLAPLQPLLDTDWVGGYVGEGAGDLVIRLRFEAILDGQVVRYDRRAPEANFSAVTHFFWHPVRETICFLTLMNREIAEEGTVDVREGDLVLQGQSFQANGVVEFETTLELDGGLLRDTFRGERDGNAVGGHVQEFTAEKSR